MLAKAALADLRSYIKRRVSFAKYRVGGSYYKTELTNVEILANGTVRVQISIIPGGTVKVDRVELYNSDGNLFAYQDCSITISTGQTGILCWFDFTVVEEVAKHV